MQKTADRVPTVHRASGKALHMAFDLGDKHWHMAFGDGSRQRFVTVTAGDLATLDVEIERAKKRFKLSAAVPVSSCYEAGRDGFWLHRYLVAHSVQNHVIDSASIEVNRRQRRAKTDRLDVRKLLTMLLRHSAGEKKVWSVVRVPSVEEEDRRQLPGDYAGRAKGDCYPPHCRHGAGGGITTRRGGYRRLSRRRRLHGKG